MALREVNASTRAMFSGKVINPAATPPRKPNIQAVINTGAVMNIPAAGPVAASNNLNARI